MRISSHHLQTTQLSFPAEVVPRRSRRPLAQMSMVENIRDRSALRRAFPPRGVVVNCSTVDGRHRREVDGR